MERASDLQTPRSIGVTNTAMLVPPRIKPATWEEDDAAHTAVASGVTFLAAPEGATADGNRLRFPKGRFPTQDAARQSLAGMYPSLAHANANPDGTYNLYNVKIFSTGTWNGDPYTVQDLDDMVEADREIGHQLKPWIKYGHDEAQAYAASAGLPRGGTVRNLRRDGEVLYGDIVDIPPPVYHAMEQKSWEGRSPEVYWDLEFSGTKKLYRRALRALSILGAELPGNPTLGNVFHAYADDDLGAAVHVARDYAEQVMPAPEQVTPQQAVHAAVTLGFAGLAVRRRYPGAVIHAVGILDVGPTGELAAHVDFTLGQDALRAHVTLTTDGRLNVQQVTLPEAAFTEDEQRRALLARSGQLIPGVPIRLTHPAGHTRTGPGWARAVPYDYGEVIGVTGADGDQLDVIIAPDPHPLAPPYAAQQLHPDGTPDEEKILLGFPDATAAREAYLNFVHDPALFGGLRATTLAELRPAQVLTYGYVASQHRDPRGRWAKLDAFHQQAARDLPRGPARNAHLATMHAARAAAALRDGQDAGPHLAALTARVEALRVHAHRSRHATDASIHDHYRQILTNLKGGIAEVTHHEKPAPITGDEAARHALTAQTGAASHAAPIIGALHGAATAYAEHLHETAPDRQREALRTALKHADAVSGHLHLLPSQGRAAALSVIHAVHARRDALGLPDPHQPVDTPRAGTFTAAPGQPGTLFGYERAQTHGSFGHDFTDAQNAAVHEMTGAHNLADLHARMTGQHPALARAVTRISSVRDGRVVVTTTQHSDRGHEQAVIQRTYWRHPSGRTVATHERMTLSHSLGSRGLGTFLAQSHEELARAAGHSEIQMAANMNVGGYAWAMNGYDFADPDHADETRDRVQRRLDRLHRAGTIDRETHQAASEDIQGAQHAWELAAVTLPRALAPGLTDEQRKVGKSGMLGAYYQARKTLAPGPGHDHANAYRAHRLAVRDEGGA